MSVTAVDWPPPKWEGASPRTRWVGGAAHLRLVPIDRSLSGRYDDVRARFGERALPPARLTRRGRLARTLLVLGLVALAALMAQSRLSGAAGVAVDHATTVEAGETLSEIAGEQLPAVPLAESVPAVQQLNKMSTTSVAAGQTLLIPRM